MRRNGRETYLVAHLTLIVEVFHAADQHARDVRGVP